MKKPNCVQPNRWPIKKIKNKKKLSKEYSKLHNSDATNGELIDVCYLWPIFPSKHEEPYRRDMKNSFNALYTSTSHHEQDAIIFKPLKMIWNPSYSSHLFPSWLKVSLRSKLILVWYLRNKMDEKFELESKGENVESHESIPEDVDHSKHKKGFDTQKQKPERVFMKIQKELKTS